MDRRAHSSFEPHRGETLAGRSSIGGQPANNASGRHFLSDPARTRDATDQPQRLPEVSSRHFGDARADLSAARYGTRVLVGATLLRPRPIGSYGLAVGEGADVPTPLRARSGSTPILRPTMPTTIAHIGKRKPGAMKNEP